MYFRHHRYKQFGFARSLNLDCDGHSLLAADVDDGCQAIIRCKRVECQTLESLNKSH